MHAVDTYSTFIKENHEQLSALPAPEVAESYYLTGDLYLFDDFQVMRKPGSRRPPCSNLYEVFVNICEDEAEHVKTMHACQDYARLGKRIVSPHLLSKDSANKVEQQSRDKWNKWAMDVNIPEDSY